MKLPIAFLQQLKLQAKKLSKIFLKIDAAMPRKSSSLYFWPSILIQLIIYLLGDLYFFFRPLNDKSKFSSSVSKYRQNIFLFFNSQNKRSHLVKLLNKPTF
jgi:hypothetical protein